MSKIIQAKLAPLNAKVVKEQAWENALLEAKFVALTLTVFIGFGVMFYQGLLYAVS